MNFVYKGENAYRVNKMNTNKFMAKTSHKDQQA